MAAYTRSRESEDFENNLAALPAAFRRIMPVRSRRRQFDIDQTTGAIDGQVFAEGKDFHDCEPDGWWITAALQLPLSASPGGPDRCTIRSMNPGTATHQAGRPLRAPAGCDTR